MGINIRAKGQNGEREIAKELNAVIAEQMTLAGQFPTHDSVQRNQMQTAVGGADLTGTMGLSIEIKRQEALAINTWWKQTEASADRNGEIPVLIYRQNNAKWQVVMYVDTIIRTKETRIYGRTVRATISFADFLQYFKDHVAQKLREGYKVVV